MSQYSVKKIQDKNGFHGLTIMEGNKAIANMVMQLDDTEMAKAVMIVNLLNNASPGGDK